jgi:hypothetical protein
MKLATLILLHLLRCSVSLRRRLGKQNRITRFSSCTAVYRTESLTITSQCRLTTDHDFRRYPFVSMQKHRTGRCPLKGVEGKESQGAEVREDHIQGYFISVVATVVHIDANANTTF